MKKINRFISLFMIMAMMCGFPGVTHIVSATTQNLSTTESTDLVESFALLENHVCGFG